MLKNIMTVVAFAALLPIKTLAFDCRTPQTQTDMNRCAGKEYRRVDTLLNAAYSKAITRAPEEQRRLLRTAQRSWLSYRDAECAFRNYAVHDGSMFPMSQAICLTELTQAREKALNDALHCVEGDISCAL